MDLSPSYDDQTDLRPTPASVAGSGHISSLGAAADLGQRVRPMVRPVIALVLIVAAYHFSLSRLVETLTLNTPLAQLGLAPFIALGLAAMARQRADEPDIHDRQLDWIVGVPLVAGALLANLVLPARLSSLFWFWRIDLLTLPFFVAGIVALLFGVRTMWRIRAALLFLLLAWPYPYSELVERYLIRFTEITITGVAMLTKVLPVASQSPGGDESLFVINNPDSPFSVQIASACSGANGLVGFMLVGVAFLLAVRGSRKSKVAWLCTGAVLVWFTNLLRIMAVMSAGRQWGEGFAIDGLHPYIGLVVFSLSVLLMVAMLPRFGLKVDLGGSPRGSARPAGPSGTSPHRPGWKVAGAIGLLATIGLSTLNSDLSSADAVATTLGSPRLLSFAQSQDAPDGWQVQLTNEYDWPKQFFGKSSTWQRYSYGIALGAQAELEASTPFIVDVIETSSRKSLAAYGVEQCYEFHGYDIASQQSVDLGSGVVGGLLTWRDPERDVMTTTLYWHWPVQSEKGTRYERVTLLLDDNASAQYTYPELDADLSETVKLGLSDVLAGESSDDGQLDARIIAARSFLVAFGRDLVEGRAAAPEE